MASTTISERQAAEQNTPSVLPEEKESKLEILAKYWKEFPLMTRAILVKDLIDEGMGKAAIAAAVGVSHVTIAYHYKLNWLCEEDKDAVRKGELSTEFAIPAARRAYKQWLAERNNEEAEEPPAARPVQAATSVVMLLDKAPDIILPEEVELPPAEIPGLFQIGAGCFPASPEKFADLDAAYERYRELIGWVQKPTPREPLAARDFTKTVVISDLHSPYQDDDALTEMIAREAPTTDRLVIAGDATDMQNWSRFDKFTQRFHPIEELMQNQKLVRLLCETFPEVILFEGNHDSRWLKYFVGRGIEGEMLDALEYLHPGFKTPIHMMIRDLPNVRMAPTIKLGPYAEFSWWFQFGDAIATHAETYSKICNRAGSTVAHWLKSSALTQGLVDPFNVVIQGHTHQGGAVWGDFGVLSIENGCMCHPGDYVGKPKIMGAPRPWMKGYTVVIQDRAGISDPKETRFIPLGY